MADLNTTGVVVPKYKRVGDLPDGYMAADAAGNPAQQPGPWTKYAAATEGPWMKYRRVGDLPPTTRKGWFGEDIPIDDVPGYMAASPDTPQEAAAKRQQLVDVTRAAANGATLNFAPRIEAGLRTGFGRAGNYAATLDSINEQNADFRSEHPVAATALEIGGGVLLPGAAAAGRVMQAPTLVGRIGRSAGVGAGMGGVSAVGRQEDLGAIDGGQVAVGTALGGVAGGTLPAIGAAIKPVAQGIAARLNIGNQAAAEDMLRSAVERTATASGNTYQQAANLMRFQSQQGGNAPLALLGNEEIQGVAHAAAASSPRARAIVQQLADDAQSGVRDRLVSQIDDAMGGRNAAQIGSDLEAARTAAASPAYAALHADPAAYDLSGAVNWAAPSVQAAMRRANTWLRDAGAQPIVGTSLTARQADALGRALNDSTNTAFRAGANEAGHAMAGLRDSFNAAAETAIPALRTARGDYRVASDQIRALEAGRALPVKEGADAEAARTALLGTASHAMPQAQLGVLQGLRDQLANTSNPAGVAQSFEGDRLRHLVALLRLGGNNTQTPAVAQSLISEAAASRNAAALARGLPAAETPMERALSSVAPYTALHTPKAGVLRAGLDLATNRMNERRAQILARMLTDDPRAALATIAQQPRPSYAWPSFNAALAAQPWTVPAMVAVGGQISPLGQR